MDHVYENTYRIGAQNVDRHNHCRPAAALSCLQEAATYAAIDLNISRDVMLRKYNVFWMLARIWFRLERPLGWDEALTVRTWHRGGKGVAMYRDFDLYVGDELVGEAVSTWVLADYDTHKMFRLSTVKEFESTSGGPLCKSKLLGKIPMPEELTLSYSRRMGYSDTDINGHVNNCRYADLVCDALPIDVFDGKQFLSEMQLGYLAECLPGDLLHLQAGQGEGQHFVQGIDDGAVSRFQASLRFSPLG